LKHEIDRRSLPIAIHLLIQAFDRDAVKFGKSGIEDNFVTAQDDDPGLDGNHGSPSLG
jgi:hypothetical protein